MDERVTPHGLRPFVPTKNFSQSRKFYEALGFSAGYSTSEIVVMQDGPIGFILQNFYEKALAENLMLQLAVPDVDAWWAARRPDDVAKDFGARAPRPPAVQPWGLKVGYVFDPSGVLWHLAELP